MALSPRIEELLPRHVPELPERDRGDGWVFGEIWSYTGEISKDP